MFAVHYFTNKDLLLSQLTRIVPAVGDELKIKGRKGKVVSVKEVDEKIIHVQIALEAVKSKVIVDPSKNKKR
jgi:hypothetical protein